MSIVLVKNFHFQSKLGLAKCDTDNHLLILIVQELLQLIFQLDLCLSKLNLKGSGHQKISDLYHVKFAPDYNVHGHMAEKSSF